MDKVYNHDFVWEHNPSLLLMSRLIATTLLTGSILVSFTTSATSDSVVDEINITVPVSCSLTGTGMNTHNAEIPNGTYQANIGSTTLKAFCNDANGFAIYATGYTGNEIGETNSNKLVGTSASGNATIVTGLATSTPNPDVSNWAMKLTLGTDSGDTTGTNALAIDSDTEGVFSSFHTVPNEYTKVAHKNSATNMDTTNGGATLTTTYAAYISKTQPADTYSGQVVYTLVHPSDEVPLQPVPCEAGKICYNANGSNVVGTMAQQSANNSTTVTLYPSNFSRTGYGFAGWSDKYDYATNPNTHFYGPNEDFTTPSDLSTKGLSLYAVWVPSEGSLQDSTKVATLCGTGTGSLTEDPANGTADLSSVTALTDQRDNQTYAIAKLADGDCWMIENLRLNNTNSDNTTGALAQGYGGAFAGLADPEEPTLFKPVYTSNSLYSINGSTEKTISGDYQDIRFPRYNNQNTASRATTTTINQNIYSYGNYYTWAAAIADTTDYVSNFSAQDDSVTTTSICPSGWHLPIGGSPSNATNSEFWQLSLSVMNFAPTNGVYKNTETNSENKNATQMLRSYPSNFVYSGNAGSSDIGGRGTYGYYWSSTMHENPRFANHLVMSDNQYSVYPGTTGNSKTFGWTIRCTASTP